MESTMTVVTPGRETRRYIFNGLPGEREEVEREFKALMSSGLYLAYQVVEAPAKGEPKNIQITEFPPEEKVEVVLTPALRGG